MSTVQESANAVFQFIKAVSETDCTKLLAIADEDVVLDIPGARFVDITRNARGRAELCEWAETVRRECGRISFEIHRYFENGCELMANGSLTIERAPRTFHSPCSFHVRIEKGKIVAFQLLLDTYALQKFRGEMD